MRIIFTITGLLFITSLQAQNVNLAWAKNIGGASDESGSSIGLDAAGNVYTTGTFRGTVDFDPGPGIYDITASGGYDIFITKLNPSGNLIWAKNIGGVGKNCFGYCLTVDAAGNVFTTGVFEGTADFDPGPGSYTLTPYGVFDVFISKLNTSGEFVWAKKIGGAFTGATGNSITLDASGNVFTTGRFGGTGTVDFDPGTGIYNMTATGLDDLYISKLDASGDFIWAKKIGGTGLSTLSNSLSVDSYGNAYTTGYFEGTIDFDPGFSTYNLTSSGEEDIFISKLDASGNFVWAKSLGGPSYDLARFIKADAAGNIFITGDFNGIADFDPGPGTYNLLSDAGGDIFISKLDPAGNLVWAKNLASDFPGDNVGMCIALDASGNVYTTGFFSSTVDFDPGVAVYNLTSPDYEDLFISKLDGSGNFLWAKHVGGSSYVQGSSLAVDASGNIYTTGFFEETADFDPDAGTYNITSAGGADIFVLKLMPVVVLPVTIVDVNAYKKNSGVEVEWSVEQESNVERYQVERSKDGQQFYKIGTVPSYPSARATRIYNFFDPTPFSGVIFYRVKINENTGHSTYSRVVSINTGNLSGNILTVYPNPVNAGTILVTLSELEKGKYIITLSNFMGQKIIQKIVNHEGGIATETITLSKPLASGLYLLNLKGERISCTVYILGAQ